MKIEKKSTQEVIDYIYTEIDHYRGRKVYIAKDTDSIPLYLTALKLKRGAEATEHLSNLIETMFELINKTMSSSEIDIERLAKDVYVDLSLYAEAAGGYYVACKAESVVTGDDDDWNKLKELDEEYGVKVVNL